MERADGEQAGELLGPVINTAGISDSEPDSIFPSLRTTPHIGTVVQTRLPQSLLCTRLLLKRVLHRGLSRTNEVRDTPEHGGRCWVHSLDAKLFA